MYGYYDQKDCSASKILYTTPTTKNNDKTKCVVHIKKSVLTTLKCKSY